MNVSHWLILAAALIGGYVVGSKNPGLISKVTGGAVPV
jgi:hypothetical protein